MNKNLSRLRVALLSVLGILLAFTLSAGILLWNHRAAFADKNDNYYYSQLDDNGKTIYNAIQTLVESDDAKTGTKELNLLDYISADLLKDYGQDSKFMTAFGGARDAYYLDHPEMFYIDFDYLSVSVGTKQDGSTTATLGTGRGDNYLADPAYKDSAKLEKAISDFNTAAQTIADNAQAAGKTVAEQITSVNKQLVDKVTYTYIPPEDSDGTYIHNPYGALVNNGAVCEGYARAFKVVMDKLGIECILVRGYAQSSEYGSYDPHMWNYVKVDNLWYAVDVTWNDGEGVPEDYYLLKGSATMDIDHIPDGAVSACGFEFDYPTLNSYDFGGSMDGFDLKIEYTNDEKKNINIQISYDGKSAQKLLADTNQYISIRYSTDGSDPDNIAWVAWSYIGSDECYNIDEDDINDNYSLLYGLSTQYEYIQLAVINKKPNEMGVYDDSITDADIYVQSLPIGNGTYGSYVSVPFTYAKAVAEGTTEKITPASLNPEKTYTIYITSDEKLKRTEDELSVTITRQNGSEITAATASDFAWDDENQEFSFTLVPSKAYGEAYYVITVNGLVAANGNTAPKSTTLQFLRKSVVCSKVFNDGRLWMNVYGSPTLVSNNDLTSEGMKDENGNSFSSNQRSQLLLVVSKPDEAQSTDMVNQATKEAGIESSDVKSSETYEIDIQLCGCVTQVPEGSYMQMAFGFPEGYGPDDAGVTFKVYHYKKNDAGEIIDVEEVEAVVTEYGIIATVKSFSPFTILAVDSSKVSHDNKYIYARTIGLGGEISTTSSNTAITKLVAGDSVTYTLTPEEGYQVDRVVVNGTEIEVTGNTFTLAFADVEENTTVEAYFVSTRVAENEQAQGITNIPNYTKVLLSSLTIEAKNQATGDTSDGSTDNSGSDNSNNNGNNGNTNNGNGNTNDNNNGNTNNGNGNTNDNNNGNTNNGNTNSGNNNGNTDESNTGNSGNSGNVTDTNEEIPTLLIAVMVVLAAVIVILFFVLLFMIYRNKKRR